MLVKAAARRTRRRHDLEFKRQLIEACQEPGVSVAAIALANGLNTNMLRKWIRDHQVESAPGQAEPKLGVESSTLVSVAVVPKVTPGEIRIDVRRGVVTMQMAWPVDAVASLGPCLRELLG